MTDRKGCQTPTVSVVLPYDKTKGQMAIDLYNASGNICQEWQEIQLNNILAIDETGKWIHSKYGYSVPRRNGKGEVLIMRELYALLNGEQVLHTAHLADTSSDAADRLATCLDNMGYTEVIRVKKDENYEGCYLYRKQYGLEEIKLLSEGGGSVSFRTRTSRGGLGRGYDVLIVDEAQEYLDDQESSLKFVVSSSKNPQTIMTGTPPTAVSAGTKFLHYRERVLEGGVKRSGWAEWSVDKESDMNDIELWYQANPSLGTVFTEEIVEDEIGDDIIDFNIQRLGLWYKNDLKSVITEKDWDGIKVDNPKFDKEHRLFVGVKFGADGENVAMSIATKTKDEKIFVELIDYRNVREGIAWLVDWLKQSKSVVKVAIDGMNGQDMMAKAMKTANLKAPVLPTVHEFVVANAEFEQKLYHDGICHSGQMVLRDSATHCKKRKIGKNGGFGYSSTIDTYEIAILDSVIIAAWLCGNDKGAVQQKIRD